VQVFHVNPTPNSGADGEAQHDCVDAALWGEYDLDRTEAMVENAAHFQK